MNSSVVQILTSLGLPAAIIALAVLAWAFRQNQGWFTKSALALLLVLMAPLGAIELYQKFNPPDLDLEVSPDRWHAFDRSGSPVDVQVEIVGTHASIRREFPGQNIFRDGLRLTQDPQGTGYHVRFGDQILGPLNSQSVDMVCRPHQEDPLLPPSSSSDFSRVWEKKRAYLNQSPVPLGQSTLGTLDLQLHSYNEDGTASVTLLLDSAPIFSPDTLRLSNKSVESLSLRGGEEFLVVVREADFRRGKNSWASFLIVGP